MAYVPVPKDLTKIKTKVALNLTKRQLVCFSAAAVAGIPVYLLTRGAIGNSMAVLVMIGLMLPFFMLAMFERDGQPAEKIIRNYMRAKLWPRVRPYKTENLYRYLSEEGKTIAKQDKAATAAPAKKHKTGKRK
jgi:hypothetical protein